MLAANTFGIRGAAMVALGPSGGQHQHKPTIGVNESRHFVAAAVARYRRRSPAAKNGPVRSSAARSPVTGRTALSDRMPQHRADTTPIATVGSIDSRVAARQTDAVVADMAVRRSSVGVRHAVTTP
ncbi:hypothetical protein KDW07_24185 [Burkholderia dolosa]|uniref:hypothetical protein n=1 Tax=Burkholderia dolosa TaxID=152500 RepID=UPI001B905A5F|nr:hypothetical protein [Burkholderia dolosa]MBR8460261.1 hypothetical protein [Burkholderia dolosa]MDN7424223.1 hypothetical protein [Burkholderia dolosa]